MADASISAADYEYLSRALVDHCALVLEPGKEYLLKSRLSPVAKRHGLASIGQLIQKLRGAPQGTLLTEFVEALVTSETSFFRDIRPFETFKNQVLPELIERRSAKRELNIWCAASSSGQEPYSLALIIKEFFPDLAGWRIRMMATDISHEMLRRARMGRYSQIEVNRGLPTPLLLKWFRQEGAHWQLDDSVRQMVTFSQCNLIEPWPAMPAWDVVFLRNVMIYFDLDAKRTILGRLARVLRDDGYLLLGGAETTLNLDDSFCRAEHLQSTFYCLKPDVSRDLAIVRTSP